MRALTEEFVAKLSHELRTPLAAILGWTLVLRRGPRDADDLARGLEIIERNARAQGRMIEELLDTNPAPPDDSRPGIGEALPGREDAEPTGLQPIDLTGTKVLAVDDDADARELVRQVLTDCFAEVATTGSAEEALRIVEEQRPDVVVSDLGMPEVGGFELLRRIRRLGSRRGGDVPVIALTAFARSADRTRALRAGFRFHAAKPIDSAELVAIVASAVGRAPGLR